MLKDPHVGQGEDLDENELGIHLLANFASDYNFLK